VRSAALPGVVDVVPGAQTVLVRVAPGSWDLADLAARVLALAEGAADSAGPTGQIDSSGELEIPVCYDGADLASVAALTGQTVAEVIARHQAAEYRVGWLGFMPGFGYLTGLDPALGAVPRLATPRLSVPAGSVAIAGGLTAVYPAASPGGWQLLGRTDARLWDAGRAPPATLAPGMRVRFRSVDSLAGDPAGHRFADLDDAGPALGGLQVIRPGPLLTVQDLGRPGLAHLGVPPSGAADPASLRLANLLAGNPEDAAALEVTLGRAVLRLRRAATVAVTGAPATVQMLPPGGPPATLPHGAGCQVPAGSELRFGSPAIGLRSYLAISGSIGIPPVLGSRATDLHAGLGMRPLQAGDLLPVGEPAPAADRQQRAGRDLAGLRTLMPAAAEVTVLHALAGPRDDWLGPAALELLAASEYEVSTASSRTGLRLSGPALPAAGRGELPSEGMVTGAIQVPPNGQPIVLLADHPTTGGYPVAAVLRSADVGTAGQLRPGQRVRIEVQAAG
jgi:KipI family sensor histidine kinase inhibitor